ncbi:MAG: ABC transporter substrate-binding protein [Bdellovibrionia bacterium]
MMCGLRGIPAISVRIIGVALLVSIGIAGCTSKSKNESLNVLHIVADEKLKGLDPIYTNDLYSGIQSSQAYETLLQYHYLKRPYELVPSLAQTLPTVSRDGLTYTFSLKKGVLFQDDPSFKLNEGKGREMTAEDVVYSFKRLADPKLSAPGWWVLDGKIVGLNAWRESVSNTVKTDYSIPVEGLKALDRYTIQLKLLRKSAQFLYSLAMPFTGIVPREAVEFYDREFINHAVGTGPFRLSEYNPNSRIVWDRNPTYRKELYPSEGDSDDQALGYLEDAGKPLPMSDRIVVQVITEKQPMWLNFLAGKLDFAGIPKDNFTSAITPKKELSPELAAKGIRLLKSAALDVTHGTFNLSDPLIGKNKFLRQAISMAFDEATFIDLFFNGRAIPAQGPIPPGVDGYDAELENPYRKFNLVKAKELLVKAGYPEGEGLPPLEYATISDSSARQQSEYFQKMMAGIGISLTVNSYSWPQFQEVIKNKKAQLWEYAWSLDYPDAENMFQLFYSKNVSPGSNDANYINPAFDRLYEKSSVLPAGPERTKTYGQMVKMLVEDCPWIFGAHRMSFVLIQPWLKNYKPNDFDHARYKYYRIDTALKK